MRKKTINGIEVLVPTVYIADADKANLTVAGAIISGDTVNMNVGDVNNSGMILAKTDLQLAATNITATGGSFNAGNNLQLNASKSLTIAAGTMQIGGETFVKSGSGVQAGGNASLTAGDALTLRGAEVNAGGDVSLTGQSVTLDTAKATNNGSDNVIGTTVQSGGDTTITATDDVNIIGSDVAAKAISTLRPSRVPSMLSRQGWIKRSTALLAPACRKRIRPGRQGPASLPVAIPTSKLAMIF
ncbi:hypothetical protein HED55_22700 [Ochrobactrum haematophilum]|uniref:Uncharacterized protein n=1 Tax=Brucella haematophila TaxID=419474 RepID=A0ABX1DPW2_9HYPH|nr:hypothetical protein [Brucella haematophila]